MIAVAIDRPLGEENIGALVLDDFPELIEMRRIQDGVTIGLSCKHGTRLEYFGGFSGLGHAYVRGRTPFLFRPLAIVEMKKNHFVPQFSEASDCAPAAVFRIPGMSSRHDDLKFFLLGIKRRLPRGIRN